MKEKILEKSTELFLKHGFKSITMDDISNQLGISKKTLYTHFKNKIALVKTSTEYLFNTICSGIDQIKIKQQNAIEELFEIKNFVLKNLHNEESSPLYQLQKYFPEIYLELKSKQLEVINECIRDNINKGLKNEMYRPNIHTDFITRIYFTGMIGIKDEEIFPSTHFKPKELMHYFLDYHIRAIATPKGIETLNKFISNK